MVVAEERKTIRGVAAECLESADGDWASAAKEMRAIVDTDRELRDELTEPLVDAAIWTALRKAARDTRTSFWNASRQMNTDRSESDDGLRSQAVANLLDYPLSKGLKLGDAFADQLSEEADMYGAFAKTNAIRERWLRMIADLVPEGAAVRDVLSNEELERLQQRAVENPD